MTSPPKVANLIFIIEDSDEDYFITIRSFKKSGMNNSIKRAKDGLEAIEYLENKNNPKPSMILLDLNLPKKSGQEVLTAIRGNPTLAKIPVIILTTSSDEKDINSCYEMGANSYIQKPVNLDSFIESIKMLKNYWFEIVILPGE